MEKILRTYPDLNPEWLLTGIGSMLKDEKGIDNVNDLLGLYFKNKEKRFEELVAENSDLKKQVKDLEKQIKDLESARKKVHT